MLLMIVQHPQRGWQSRTRVLCGPRSGRRSLTATAAEGTRSSAPSLLVAAARRERRPFIMRGRSEGVPARWAGRSGRGRQAHDLHVVFLSSCPIIRNTTGVTVCYSPSRRGKTVIEGQHASPQRSNSVLKKMCPSPAQTVRRLFAKEAATEPPIECSAENGSRQYFGLA